MDDRVRRFFKEFRDHQRNVWASGGGTLTTFRSGRTELTFASSPFGEHALNAFVSAKRHVAFLDRLKNDAR